MRVLVCQGYGTAPTALETRFKVDGCEVLLINSPQAALQALQDFAPVDVAFVDMSATGLLVSRIAKEIYRHSPQTAVVLVGETLRDGATASLIQSGVAGFLPRAVFSHLLHLVFQKLLQQSGLLSSAPAAPNPALLAGANGASEDRPEVLAKRVAAPLGLTPRQMDILRLLIKGMPNKKICHELRLSENTVKGHITQMMKTMGVANRTQCAIEAKRLGIDQ